MQMKARSLLSVLKVEEPQARGKQLTSTLSALYSIATLFWAHMFVQLLETRRFLRVARVNVRHSIDMRSSRGLEESCRHVATFL